MQRGSGILLGISSLPGKFGIGTLGSPAHSFVDKLKKAGQKYWQVLPITQTGFGDSPYQSISAYAINPYFIDLNLLQKQGLLTADEVKEHAQLFEDVSDAAVNYSLLYENRFLVLRLAYNRGIQKFKKEFTLFKINHSHWLNDYAMFLVIKKLSDNLPYWLWDEKLKERHPSAIMGVARDNETDIEFYQFVQYLAFEQWYALRTYALEKEVEIIGDIPIYVAPDSADIWANPHVFDKSGNVAGCPPDYFSKDGQLWGNPLYDWHYLKETGYKWWVNRIAHNLTLFDYLRIDHFRGFESYYSIPKSAITAATGHWEKGPGMDLFNALKYNLGELPIIAEDLGVLTQGVFDFMRECGFPGLKVLHFAFSPTKDSIYLPHNLNNNCVIYTGTHDNDTTVGWFKTLPKEEKAYLRDYLGECDEKTISEKLIRLAYGSVADVCLIPMQDILGKGTDARMNIPSKGQGNWQWRLCEDEFDTKTVSKLKKLATTFGR